MKVRIFSINEKIYDGECKSVILPGVNGQFQILNNHAPIFALLGNGEIIIENVKKASIFSGIVEALNNDIIILVHNMQRTPYIMQEASKYI